MADPDPIFDALEAAQRRRPMATAMDTAELREMAARFRSNAVFTARGTSAAYVSVLKEVIAELAAGRIGEADARVTLMEALRALGYTPEGGFPDAPAGAVPPAIRGTLQDLSSFRRIDLIIRTQLELVTGAGMQYRGHHPDRLRVAPGWELIRALPVEVPRGDWDARWTEVGGVVIAGRIVAFKGDPRWGELGSSGNFSDALDVDHGPFWFGSGGRLREVLRREVIALGVRGPNGETLEEWEAGERPRVIRGELPVPDPAMSTRDIDPEIAEILKADPETETVPGKETILRPAGSTSRAERRAAREARSAERWKQAAVARERVEATNP